MLLPVGRLTGHQLHYCCLCQSNFCRSVEVNPVYGGDDYEEDNEINDTNDYYFYAKPGDEIEITDTNQYYE